MTRPEDLFQVPENRPEVLSDTRPGVENTHGRGMDNETSLPRAVTTDNVRFGTTKEKYSS